MRAVEAKPSAADAVRCEASNGLRPVPRTLARNQVAPSVVGLGLNGCDPVASGQPTARPRRASARPGCPAASALRPRSETFGLRGPTVSSGLAPATYPSVRPAVSSHSAHLSESQCPRYGSPQDGKHGRQYVDAPGDETAIHRLVTTPWCPDSLDDLSFATVVPDLERVRLVAHLRSAAHGVAASTSSALAVALPDADLNRVPHQVQLRESTHQNPGCGCRSHQCERAIAGNGAFTPPGHDPSIPCVQPSR